VEYFFGQYLAIWSMFLICRFTQMHVVGGNLIMFATNAASCFNHQRYDIKIPFFGTGINLYESKAHDLHHRIPNVNYGQYIQLWDWVFGTHRPYKVHEKDPINPLNQLDATTGQTLAHEKQHKKVA
jgi:sterol desaturase/sphingolipid hydroxylase (fatty acid hydroxylase superfamily)